VRFSVDEMKWMLFGLNERSKGLLGVILMENIISS
jgi:hypothetical protein